MSLSMIPWMLRGNVFDDLESVFKTGRSWYDDSGFPVVDQFDEEGKVVLEFALAGYEQEALSVTFENSQLIVAATKDENKTVLGTRKIAKRAFEKRYVDRTGTLDLGGAQASFKNGILRVEIPKKQVEVKRIEVK